MTATSVFIGIDPTAGGRLHTLAVLDFRLKVARLEKARFEELIEIIEEYPSTVCGIDAPLAPSKGLMADPDYRKRRINLYNTPLKAEDAPHWMKEGWRIYDALRKAGFVEYPRAGERRMFE